MQITPHSLLAVPVRPFPDLGLILLDHDSIASSIAFVTDAIQRNTVIPRVAYPKDVSSARERPPRINAIDDP